jgi:holo-[acyl-carrier protein] synthase
VAVIGVGVDLVAVDRLAAVLARTPAVRDRLFAAGERELPMTRLAGRFAAKEAVAKVLGAPAGLAWQDVEVRTDDAGRPSLAVRGTVAAAADRLGVRRWHVSLSHDAGMAIAVVVAES